MFALLESGDRAFIEHLQTRMTQEGITCLAVDLGSTPDGNTHVVLQLPVYGQMEAARTLLYRSGRFLRSVHPDFHEALLQVRQAPRHPLIDWLSAPWAVRVGAACLAIALLGYAIEWLA